MNILFVLSSFAHAAGVQRVISDKMNYLAEHGHHVVFATYEQGQHPLIFPLYASVKHVDLACPYFTLYHYPLFIRLLKARSMKRMFLQRLQALIDEHSIDVLVTTTNASMFMSEMMKMKHVRKIVESHGAFTKTMIADNFYANVGRKIILNAIKKCDLLITLTNSDAQYWRKFVKNVDVHPNPVSFYFDDVEHFEKIEGRIIAVGGLNKHKRFDRLIDAFALIAAKNSQWYIDIYGEGENRSSLEKQIKEVGLESRIHLNGSTHQIAIEYQRSQMFVLSSDTEGFPLVLIEAMASGLPCVATDCPFGPASIIEDGVTGLLTQMTVIDLAAKMDWMITHEKERKEIGRKAHQMTAKYRKENIMKEWEQAYVGCLKLK